FTLNDDVMMCERGVNGYCGYTVPFVLVPRCSRDYVLEAISLSSINIISTHYGPLQGTGLLPSISKIRSGSSTPYWPSADWWTSRTFENIVENS
ncbi:jg25272, partial [Pararge aegeria aegeria]